MENPDKQNTSYRNTLIDVLILETKSFSLAHLQVSHNTHHEALRYALFAMENRPPIKTRAFTVLENILKVDKSRCHPPYNPGDELTPWDEVHHVD